MKKNGFFALMARMKYIGRWGLMRSAQTENVAEHSLMVAVLAHALAVIRRDVFGGTADPDRCAAAALYHDAPEIITGDLPTPVKYFNPAIQTAYQAIERDSARRILAMLPDEMRPAYEQLFFCEAEDAETYALVKAADRLSAYIKCIEELKSGNTEYKIAAEGVYKKLTTDPLPEVSYFLSHFLDAFHMTLDELK